MKLSILYRTDSEQARPAEELARDFENTRGQTVELVDVNTRDGAAYAELYDVMQFPTILITRDDGQLVKDWHGEQLPLMDEVAGYLN